VEGFQKPWEGKSKSLESKIKARESEFQASFFRESGLFKGLRANPNCEHLSNSTLGCRRQRAWTCEDAPPQRLATRTEPRLHRPQSMPASLPAALAALWGTKSNYSTDLENRKQKSHGAVRLSAITHGSYIRISLARPEPGSTAFKHSTGGRFPFRPGNVRTGECGNSQTPRNSVNDKRDFNLWILVALSRRGAVPKPPGSRSLRHSLIFLFRFGVQLPRSFKICNNLLSKFPLERFDKRRF